MKFDFPKIVREVSLSEYAPEIPSKIFVWVNPPQKLLTDLAEALKLIIDGKGQGDMNPFFIALSGLLSQSDDKWSVDDLQDLFNGSQDTDPGFWMWFQNRIFQEINDHRLQRKKS